MHLIPFLELFDYSNFALNIFFSFFEIFIIQNSFIEENDFNQIQQTSEIITTILCKKYPLSQKKCVYMCSYVQVCA